MNTYVRALALLAVCLGSVAPAIGQAGTGSQSLEPFTSDGCSVSPDGTLFDRTKWLSCCVEHDKKYWLGGIEADRYVADEGLRKCLESEGMIPLEADAWFQFVRIFGGVSGASYRWGYGWKPRREAAALSPRELEMAKPYLPLLDLPVPIHMPPTILQSLDRDAGNCLALVRKNLVEKGRSDIASQEIKLLRLYGAHLSYEVFSPVCPGGYFVAEFPNIGERQYCQYIAPTETVIVSPFGECVQSN